LLSNLTGLRSAEARSVPIGSNALPSGGQYIGLSTCPGSKEDLGSEREHARIVGTGRLTELSVLNIFAETIEFCVVEGVERLKSNFQPGAFLRTERNALEKSQVPFEDSGTDDRIFPRRPEDLVRVCIPWRRGGCKSGSTE